MKPLIRVAVLSLAAIVGLAPAARAADEVVTVGACQPITGRFAFAGAAINQGLQDYLNLANEKKLVPGRTFRYVYEDCRQVLALRDLFPARALQLGHRSCRPSLSSGLSAACCSGPGWRRHRRS